MERAPSQWMEHELLESPTRPMREQEEFLHVMAIAHRLPLNHRADRRRPERWLPSSSTIQPSAALETTSGVREQNVNVVITVVPLHDSAYAVLAIFGRKNARLARHEVVRGIHSGSRHDGALGAITLLSRHDGLLSVPYARGIRSTHVANGQVVGSSPVRARIGNRAPMLVA